MLGKGLVVLATIEVSFKTPNRHESMWARIEDPIRLPMNILRAARPHVDTTC